MSRHENCFSTNLALSLEHCDNPGVKLLVLNIYSRSVNHRHKILHYMQPVHFASREVRSLVVKKRKSETFNISSKSSLRQFGSLQEPHCMTQRHAKCLRESSRYEQLRIGRVLGLSTQNLGLDREEPFRSWICAWHWSSRCVSLALLISSHESNSTVIYALW